MHNSWFQNFLQKVLEWSGQCGAGMRIDIDKWNRNESPEINLEIYIYGRLFFYKATGLFNGRINSLFNRWFWDNWLSTCKGIKLDPFTPCTKINSKHIRDQTVNAKNIKLLGKNIAVHFREIGLSIFLDMTKKWRKVRLIGLP